MQLKIISSFLILLSLVFLVPSVVFAATSDGSVDSKVEINDSIENGPTLANGYWFGRSVENVGDLDGNGVNDLAVWVSEDRITLADMIVSIEHLINN